MVLKIAVALVVGLAWPVGGWCAPEYTSFAELSPKQLQSIQRGDILLKTLPAPQDNTTALNAYALVAAPPKVLLATIIDYAALPAYTPNLKQVDVLSSDASGDVVNFHLALPFGVEKRYRLRLTYAPPQADTDAVAMTWLIQPWDELKPEETIQFTSGYWFMQPTADQQTELSYHTETDPGEVPFGLGWIVDYLSHQTIIELLEHTKARAEQQWQAQQHPHL